jgi:hypothetical protein
VPVPEAAVPLPADLRHALEPAAAARRTSVHDLALLIGAFKWLEDSCLKAANAVITVCPDLRDYVLGGLRPRRHLLIENSIFDDVRLRGPGPGERRTGKPPVVSAAGHP